MGPFTFPLECFSYSVGISTAWGSNLLFSKVTVFLKPSVLTLFIGQVFGDFSMPLWAGGIGLLLWMSVGCTSIHISSSCITCKSSCSHYAAFSDAFSGSWISWVVLLCDADTTLWHSLHMNSSSWDRPCQIQNVSKHCMICFQGWVLEGIWLLLHLYFNVVLLIESSTVNFNLCSAGNGCDWLV